MPAPLHLICHALLGAFAAWNHRGEPNLRQHILSWPLLTAMAAAAALLVPATTYQTRMYPCHAAGYSLSPELQPELWAYLGPITLALVLVNLGSLMLGFVLMRRALITGHTHLAALTASAVGSCAVAAAAWAHDRVFSYGSTHAFWDGRAANIVETPSAWLCLLAYGACALCVRQAAQWARTLRAPIS